MNAPRRSTSSDGSAVGLDSCRWVRIQLPRYLDDELPADLTTRVSAHLERCDACVEELGRVQDDLCDVIDHLVAAEPPAGLLARLHLRLDEEMQDLPLAAGAAAQSAALPAASPPASPARVTSPLRLGPRVRALGPGLAAAALLAGILWGWPSGSTEDDPVAPRAPVAASSADEDAASRGIANLSTASRSTAPGGDSARAGLTLAALEEDEMLYSGGIECITFEEAIDTVIVGPVLWGTQLPGSVLSAPGVGAAGAARLVRRGDIDGNGRFEWKDLQGLFGYLGEGRDGEAPPECLAAADFDGDGVVTVHDSVIAAQALARSAEWTGQAPELFAYESDNPLPCRSSCP